MPIDLKARGEHDYETYAGSYSTRTYYAVYSCPAGHSGCMFPVDHKVITKINTTIATTERVLPIDVKSKTHAHKYVNWGLLSYTAYGVKVGTAGPVSCPEGHIRCAVTSIKSPDLYSSFRAERSTAYKEFSPPLPVNIRAKWKHSHTFPYATISGSRMIMVGVTDLTSCPLGHSSCVVQGYWSGYGYTSIREESVTTTEAYE